MPSRTVDLTVMHALHDAFRRDLETLTRAAAVLGDDPDAQERLRVGWTVLADQLHHHHTVEDEQLWPLVRRSWRRSPDALQVLDAMEDEHVLVDPALAAVGEDVRQGVAPAESLDRLNSVVRDHLAHEEREAMPLIASAVTPRTGTPSVPSRLAVSGSRGRRSSSPGCCSGRTTSAPSGCSACCRRRCAGPTATAGSRSGARATAS
jgi:iron-sulfur cluster repair protein YtfE (RIC family)